MRVVREKEGSEVKKEVYKVHVGGNVGGLGRKEMLFRCLPVTVAKSPPGALVRGVDDSGMIKWPRGKLVFRSEQGSRLRVPRVIMIA